MDNNFSGGPDLSRYLVLASPDHDPLGHFSQSALMEYVQTFFYAHTSELFVPVLRSAAR